MIKLHPVDRHRARQLRWVFSSVGLVFIAAVLAWLIFYWRADQSIESYTWSAHRKITHTGQMVTQATWIGIGVLALLSVAIAIWRFRVTNRIVRPVHALHLALDALAAGNLAVRIELKETDEFHEVAESLNKLATHLDETVRAVRDRADALLLADPDNAGLRAITATLASYRHAPAQVIREE